MMKTLRPHRKTERLAIVLMATGILGTIFRFTVKDRIAFIAPVFYGLPPLIVVVIFVLSGVLCVYRRNKRTALLAFGGVIISIFVWICSDYVYTAQQNRTGDGFTIVFWNIGPPAKPKDEFIPNLKEANGQIIVLAESGRNDENARRFWTSHFPGYHISLLGGGLILLSIYPISNASMQKMKPRTWIGVYNLDTPFGMFSIVAPDIVSNPLVSRKPSIERTYQIATSQPYPTIVLGDFNTPHSSTLFADFRRTFRLAFEEAGKGLITTWPAFLPVLALDHIWLSKHFIPMQTRLSRTFHSDHALIIAYVQTGGTEK